MILEDKCGAKGFLCSPCTFSLARRKVIWSLTNFCAVGCGHCFRGSSATGELRSITDSEVRSVISAMKSPELKSARLVISGGEPLNVPNISEVLNALAISGIDYSVCTSLIGASLQQITLACSAGLSYVTVGVDFYHAANRESYTLEMLKRIDLLQGLSLKANVCVDNDSHVACATDLVTVLGRFQRITISTLAGGSGQRSNKAALALATAEVLREYVSVPIEIRIPQCDSATCPSGKEVFWISGGLSELRGCPESPRSLARFAPAYQLPTDVLGALST